MGKKQQSVHGFALPEGNDAADLVLWPEFAIYFEKHTGLKPDSKDLDAVMLFEFYVEGAYREAVRKPPHNPITMEHLGKLVLVTIATKEGPNDRVRFSRVNRISPSGDFIELSGPDFDIECIGWQRSEMVSLIEVIPTTRI